MKLRLLIADDHRLFRQGLRQLCEVNGGYQVLAEASSGVEALRLALELRPDIILLDIRMPEMSGIDVARQILRSWPQSHIIIITMYHQDHYVRDAFDAGVRGYLLKNSDEQAVFSAIEAVNAGQAWVDPLVAPALLSEFTRRREGSPAPSLDEQDLEILRLVAHGKSNEAIAAALHLSKGTVANRLRDIFDEIQVQNRTEAALYALRRGITTLDDI